MITEGKKLATLLALVAIGTAVPAGAEAPAPPIFDTHLHYSRPAWTVFDPATVAAKLEQANVPRALVSSTPDDGSLALLAHDGDRFQPVLRPYRSRADMADWFRNPEIVAYLARRLERGVHLGIGEFHLINAAQAGTPEIKQLTELALAHDIMVHVHAGPEPVEALFAVEPKLKILWAHAGLSTPAAGVDALLARYDRLWTELSFRAGDIAPGGRLDPAWAALFQRYPDRFMIGTDTYVNARWAAYGEVIAAHRRWLAQLPRPLAEAIAFRNATRLFGAGNRPQLRD